MRFPEFCNGSHFAGVRFFFAIWFLNARLRQLRDILCKRLALRGKWTRNCAEVRKSDRCREVLQNGHDNCKRGRRYSRKHAIRSDLLQWIQTITKLHTSMKFMWKYAESVLCAYEVSQILLSNRNCMNVLRYGDWRRPLWRLATSIMATGDVLATSTLINWIWVLYRRVLDCAA